MAALPAPGEHPDIDLALFAELLRFCKDGLLEELRQALYYEKDVLGYFLIRTQKGSTLIHEAVESDQADVTQLLLLHGVSPNVRAKGGLTPLHVAASKGHVGCVTALLEAGADLSLRDDFGHDAIAKAERSKKRDPVIRLLLSKEIVHLAERGDIRVLEKRLSSARSLELGDIEQALLTAIQSSHDEAIPLLVVAGARRLDCALYLAIQLERVKAIAILLLCKATITGDFQAIHSLLSEPPDTENMPWYMLDVHRILSQGGIKMSYPIAVSIMEKNFEATKELLLRTDLDMRRKQVDWSRLKLTILHSSWMYSIAPWVITLRLSNNHLRKLPKELFTAVQLRRLDLSHNLLVTVPPEIFSMPNLDNLALNHNRISELPDTSEWSSSLLSLDLSNNVLTTLPLCIQQSSVEILNLSRNNFSVVPKCLCRIRSLTSLDLSYMPISSLPREMENLDHLVNLNVTNSNITDLQGGGVLRGTFKGFFKARARSNKPSHFVKVVVLCYSPIAKLMMYSRLKQVTPPINSLPAFEVFQWNTRPLFSKKFLTAQRLYFNTWMVSGQPDFATILPCFFSNSALYVIAWDMLQHGELREQIKLYLDLLTRHIPTANILVIAVIPDNSEAWVEANGENFTKRLNTFFNKPAYSTLQYHGLLLISNGSKDPQPDIRQKIYDISSHMTIHGQSIVGKTYPENYYSLIPILEKEQNAFASYRKPGVLEEHILWSLFDRALSVDPPDKMELPVIVNFLRETGFLLHYEDPNDHLDTYYFTRPEWLFETLYKVLQHTLAHSSHVIVSRSELCSLASINWSRDVSAALLRLMTRFSIALPISSNNFLLPCLLPHSHLVSSQVSVGTLRRQFAPKTRALPVDMWPRLICRVLANIPFILKPVIEAPENEGSSEGKLQFRPRDECDPGAGYDTDDEAPDGSIKGQPSCLLKSSSSGDSDQDMCPLPRPVTSHPLDDKSDLTLHNVASESSLDVVSPVKRPKSIPTAQAPPEKEKKASPLPADSGDFSRTASFPDPVRPRVGRLMKKQRSMTYTEPVMIKKGFQVWNCGVIHQRKGVNFSIYPCHCEMSSVEERGIEICTTRNSVGRATLARLCRLVQKLLEERYPELFSHDNLLHRHELTQLAICPICVENSERNPSSFLVEACVHALKEKEENCNCRYHAKSVPLEDLIPDYLMADFPQHYNLPHSSFQYCDSRPVQRTKQASLHQGCFKGVNVTVKVQHFLDGKSITYPLSYIRQEMQMLLQLNHPNIVKAFGFCLQPACLLVEEAPQGNLHQKLLDSEQKISRNMRFFISCQVASALDYLHKKKIIYRTLRSNSILVWSLEFADEISVKLSNFDRAEYSAASGLVGRTSFASYPAPEMVRYSFREEYSEKVDIYSFGILLYELVTRWQPFSESSNPERMPVSQQPKLSGVNTTGYSTLVKLMQECWQEDITLRPSAYELMKQLCQPAFHCHIGTQVLRDCLSVRGCCFVPSVGQIWVYGEYNKQVIYGDTAYEVSEGTQVFILNAETLMVQGSIELKERASSIHTVDSKVWIGMTEACVHAYDTTTYRFTDRFYLKDSVTAIAVNETYAFIAQANGELTYYSKLQFPKSCQTIEIGKQPIISMITVCDDLWLSCGNEIVMLSADDDVFIEKRWAACKEEDQIYTMVLSQDARTVWSLVRGEWSITSWDVSMGERIHVTELGKELMTVCCELNYDPSFLRLVSLECVDDTLWLGLTCGVIVVLTASPQPEVVCHFRAHKKATRCIMGIPARDMSRQDHPVILSGGFGEVSSLSSAVTLQNGVIMLWQALSAEEFRLLSRRSHKCWGSSPSRKKK